MDCSALHDTCVRIADNPPLIRQAGATRRTPISTQAQPPRLTRVVVFGAAAPTRAWLDALRARLPVSVVVETSGHARDDFEAALDHAAQAAAPDLTAMLLADAQLPPHAWRRLLAVASATAAEGPVVTPLCAATPGLEPWHDRNGFADATLEKLDSACFLRGTRTLSPVTLLSSQLSLWPAASLASWRGRTEGLTLQAWLERHPAVLCDHLLVGGGRAHAAPHASLVPASPAIAALRAGFAPMAAACWPGLDGKPVILHVSHAWGGGIARFIEDLASADPKRRHFVLSAHGSTGGPLGRRLEVCEVGAPTAAEPLRQAPLDPPIAAIAEAHQGYREALTRLLRDFAITQVWVSSLLGHSLDALRTDVPTVVVNHDYAAWWPELHADFGDAARAFDREALATLLESGANLAPMPSRSATQWTLQREELLRTLLARRPAMVAPSAGVRANLLRMEPSLAALEWHVIAHGVRPFASAAGDDSVSDPGLIDARPRLLVPGRLNGGKGDALLAQCIEALAALADVWLVGCGPSFEKYLGVGGVHIVFDYDRDGLPALLARIRPQLALLPVSVAESYSYLLSELTALGVPTLATALGAYRDRIEDGVDGFLVEPDADAIVSRVGDLLAEPQRLLAVREQLAVRPMRTLAAMRDDYATLLPQAERSGYPIYRHDVRGAALDALRAEQAATVRHARALDARLLAVQAELERRADWVARTDSLFRDRSRELVVQCERADGLADRLSVADDQRAQAIAAVAHAQQQAQSLEQELQQSRAQAAALAQSIDELLHSRSWRVTAPLRRATIALRRVRSRIRFRLSQWRGRATALRRSLASRGLRGTLAHIRQRGRGSPYAAMSLDLPAAAAFAPFDVPGSDSPLASIVVPVFNHFEHTLTCLRALAATADPSVPFEVIVVDDCSTDETRERLAGIGGIVVQRQAANGGFIAACNAGLARARGEFVVFLNNDTAVQPNWLSALLDTFERFPDTGLAGSKLVYPDGRLQEAGGIVFADASGWNYGRFEDPDDPRFNYVREVDYCSGASIALRRELLVELGGFDPLYAPAYYEDTDLAMRVRAHGLKVRYQPASVVVHFEGVSSGTDTGSGTKRFQPINQVKFLDRWRDTLRAFPMPGSDIALAREHRATRRILVIDACTPMPDHDAGSLRMWNILRLLIEDGAKVTFFSENLAHHGRYTEALQQLGVEALFHPFVHDIPAWLDAHGSVFDAVLVSRHGVATPLVPLLRESAPQASVIFDTVDLHFLREQRAAELEGGRADLLRAAAQTRALELALVRSCDVTLVVSPFERDLLRSLVPQARVEVLATVHDIAGTGLPFAERNGLLFVGGFQHTPNIDAVEWLVGEIWPLVSAALPDVVLNIVGSRMPDALRAKCTAAGARVVVHGFVEDLEPLLFTSRLSLAPLRYGAGIKGKINEAMAHGLPVVATPLAVEGMHVADGESALVAANAQGFADAIARAHGDEALWSRLASGGLANVATHFSFDAARAALATILPRR